MIQYVLYAVSFLVFLYLACSTAYLLMLALAGRWIKGVTCSLNRSKKRIAVLIPAYQEDTIIVNTALKAVSHNYPPASFTVLIIADQLRPDTIQHLKAIPVQVLEVNFDVSTKARSLHAGLQYLRDGNYDIGVVLDADNIMQENCLEYINDIFQRGCKTAQCHRIAKNKDTPVSLLDAISEEINTNLLRRGPAVLGLSAAPAGSGMALEFDLLSDIFSDFRIQQSLAEDREIDLQLMKRRIRMEFLNDAFVYDEKVEDANVFQKQRTRWLEAQMSHMRRFNDADIRKAPKTALYYNKLLQNFLLPRLLYLVVFSAIAIMLLLQSLIHYDYMFPSPGWWLACIAGYFLVLLISIPSSFYTSKTLAALAYIPVLMFSMIKALLQLQKNRKDFLHTRKTVTIK